MRTLAQIDVVSTRRRLTRVWMVECQTTENEHRVLELGILIYRGILIDIKKVEELLELQNVVSVEH